MKIKASKIWFLSLGILVSSVVSITLASNDPKINIDLANKKITITSGDQTIDSTSVKSLSGSSVSKTAETTQKPTTVSTQQTATGTTSAASNQNSHLHDELNWGTELDKAIYWMYQNGLTKYNTLPEYRPYDPLLREEASKIITQAYNILGYPTTTKSNQCDFSDKADFDPSLSWFIAKSCEYWIFKGANWKFLARNALTKAEALTVLIRIFEWAMSNEELNPRWTIYFIKAKAIFLTKETNVNALNKPITREEIALLIYRFKTIVLNNQLKSAAQGQLSNINQNPTSRIQKSLSGSTVTGAQTPSNELASLLSGNTNTPASTLSILNSPEVSEAMFWMRETGITNATNISTFNPFDSLTREQAAKMVVQYAKSQNIPALSGSDFCSFTDLTKSDPTLQSSIKEACQLGLMQGNGKLFNPKQTMKKAEFIALLIRISEKNRLDEKTNPRWSNYFIKAKELGIINNEDYLSFEAPLTRYEAGLLLYRFYVKQKIIKNLNTSQLKNQLISTVKSLDEKTYAIGIDTNLLKNQYFQEGYVELMWQRYLLKKTSMSVFDIWEESFVRYWDLFSISNENKIGSLTLIVSNGNVIDGTIRLIQESNNRKIKPDPTTTARYQLSK